MTHEDVKRWLTVPVEELDVATRDGLEEHLASCAACRTEAAVLQRLHDEVLLAAPVVSDEDVAIARHLLFRSLRQRTDSVAWKTRLQEFFGLSFGRAWRPVLAAGVVAAVAFFAGSVAFRGGSASMDGIRLAAYDPSGQDQATGMIQILNLRVLDQDPTNGDIELQFEAVQPAHIKGKMDDPYIQAILARALVSSQNPGVRLRAANAITAQVEGSGLDRRSKDLVKESLISALLYDKNRGVRMEALKALEPFLPDSAATAAIVQVLKQEENVAMRIAAINCLDLSKYDRAPAREQLREVLRDQSQSDANHYIRIRAASALQEDRP